MYFPSTHWSLLARASLSGETSAEQALEELCHRYWLPLHYFIRSRGHSEEEARDLTQEFVLHLLEHSTLKKADRFRGRFRSFLLGALMRFLSDHYDRRGALKRGSGSLHVSLDDPAGAEGLAELVPPGADALSFDREWALTILEHAFHQIQQEIERDGGAARFAVLRRFLPGALEAPPYEEAAAQLEMGLPAFKSELHRLRRRFKDLVRQEVASTVSAPHEIEQEMEYLQNVLMDKGSDLTAGAKPSVPSS